MGALNMEPLDTLYAAFPPVEKSAWIARLEKDLKGQPLSELVWEPEPGLQIDAFYTRSDRPAQRAPLINSAGMSAWEIGEILASDSIHRANEQAREAQAGGVQALGVNGLLLSDVDALQQLLEGLDARPLSWHFSGIPNADIPSVLETLGMHAAHRGTLCLDPTDMPLDTWRSALEQGMRLLPGFRTLHVDGRAYYSPTGSSSSELASMLAKGAEYLARLHAAGLALDQVVPHIHFSVSIGRSYFLEMAKLRALRILWTHILMGYGIQDPGSVHIAAHVAPDPAEEQVYSNMIRAAVQAMAAVLGGADCLFVLPADMASNTGGDSFTRRMARNVQHLLASESHLGMVADPAAGSYYIEALTDALCIRSWEQFVAMDQKRVFG